MISFSRVLVFAGLFSVAAVAQQVACPATQAGVALSNVDVFDGPLSEQASLVPDLNRGTAANRYASWKVGYIFDQGRVVYLGCHYGDKVVPVKAQGRVAECVFRSGTPDKPASAECR